MMMMMMMMKQQNLFTERKEIPVLLLHLKSTNRKPGTKMMYAFLFGSWLMVALWLVVSTLLLAFNWQWACLMLFSTIAFGWYLKQVGAGLESARTKSLDLKVDSEKLRLSKYDYKTGQSLEDTLYWDGVRWAEVYRYVDEPSMILQGWDKSIEIPLWAFGPNQKSIVNLLKTRKIPVLRLP